MPIAHLFGPWRAIPVLGVTQIVAWGSMYYTPVLIMPRIAAELGWSAGLGMGGFAAGLLIAGLCAPRVGALIDRYGGHGVMAGGSLLGAVGLIVLASAHGVVAFGVAWMLLGVAMSANLYEPAFATLGRIFGIEARAPITALTLIGGFASTVSWPLTYRLMEAVGWRSTYVMYAVALVLIAAPLHAFALPRVRAETARPPSQSGKAAPAFLPPTGLPFVLVATAFTLYAFVPSGMSAHMLAIFQRLGIDPATVVVLGAMFGPAQVAARLCEFMFARRIHPLYIARFAVGVLLAAFVLLFLLGFSVRTAVLLAVMYGGANGLATIARGTVPLALFGASGYGRLVGRIGKPTLIMQALSPLALGLVIENVSEMAALALLAAFTAVALACFMALRRPT